MYPKNFYHVSFILYYESYMFFTMYPKPFQMWLNVSALVQPAISLMKGPLNQS